MSERGAEGILRRRAEEQARQAPAQPVDQGTAGHQPGRVKAAAKGAAGGAVAGPEGAGLGAITGFLSGGKGKRSSSNKALVAEFAICMALLALSPLVDKGGDVTTAKWMKKASATAAVFVILGFLAATGDVPRKVANGLGLLMTLTVLLNERSVFGTLVEAVSGQGTSIPKVGSPDTTPSFASSGPTGSLGEPLSLQDQLEAGGNIAADAGTAVHNWVVDNVGPLFGTSDANGNGLTPTEQKALQGDPLVNFFKGIFG